MNMSMNEKKLMTKSAAGTMKELSEAELGAVSGGAEVTISVKIKF